MDDRLFTPLTLPGGATLPNRIAKAAMEENLAEPGQLPGARVLSLYRRWAAGGAGLLITGNVMVDARALTGPGGIVLDAHVPLDPFRRWARAAHEGGARIWAQINHPGRQVYADMPGVAWAPSDVAVDLGRKSKYFAAPTAMTAEDIAATVGRFAVSARRAEDAGFDGVEVHAAHGYLLSQFLSPRTNLRTDRWGGDLTNRARMLTEVVTAVRAAVSPGFAVAVKLNSADFQRGGFDAADARAVVALLGGLGVDLVELSGGSVESPAMQGRASEENSLAREAYFLSFAEDMLGAATVPLMITGGITRRAVAREALARGVAVVGMGTALAVAPDLPLRWRDGEAAAPAMKPVGWKDRTMAAAAQMARVRHQIHRLAADRRPRPQVPPSLAFALDRRRRARSLRAYRDWLPAHAVDTASRAGVR